MKIALAASTMVLAIALTLSLSLLAASNRNLVECSAAVEDMRGRTGPQASR